MAEKIKTFKQLEVWKKSHQVTLRIYKITNNLPQEEKYGLVNQMRRAAVSVPANIVEGFRRRSKKEKLQFHSISQASADELLYFPMLCKDLGYLKNIEQETRELESVIKMLSAMMRKISSSS